MCKAYTPGKTEQDFNTRIARLERIVEAALPQFCSPDDAMPPIDGQDDDDTSQTHEHDPNGGTFESGKWYGHSVSGSVAPRAVLAQASRCSFVQP